MKLQAKFLAFLSLSIFLFTACDKKDDDAVDTPPAAAISAFNLIYVNDMAIDVSTNPSLVWQGASAADGSAITYTVLLDKSTDLDDGELPSTELETGLTANFFTVVAPLVGGEEYQWYVIATSANGDIRRSTAVFTFTTGTAGGGNQPPGAFNLLTPTNGEDDVLLEVDLTWQASVDPDGDPVEYVVFFGTNPGSLPSVAILIAPTTLEMLGLAESTTYTWNVLAVDDKGNSTWCNNTFAFDTQGPTAPLIQTLKSSSVRSGAGVGIYDGVVGSQIVELNGMLYDLGGFSIYDGQGLERNDVLRSSDGINWELIREHDSDDLTAFVPSEEHQALVYNNLIYVFDGNRNTIHISADGVNWSNLEIEGSTIDDTHYLPRHYHQTVVFQNKLWMIGGSSYTDVWMSEDAGVNWTKVKEDNDAQWSLTAQHQVVVLNDAMYLIGGIDYDDDSRSNEVWRSTDGANWTYMSTPDFAAPLGFQAAIMEVENGADEIWVISGNISNEIWTSTDGINWELIASGSEVEMPFRGLHEAIFFNDEIWVFNGKGQSLGQMRQSTWSFGH